MRNKQKSDYNILQRKIYLQIAIITVVALVAVALLRALASNRQIGNFIVYASQRYFNMSYDKAYAFYWSGIRQNIDYITFATVAAFFIILSRFLLLQFAKYFNEISNGLNALVENRNSEIKLSPEMVSMEYKLNSIKQTLEEQEREAKQAEQRKNDLVTYLAHDIKTPLTSVIGYLSLLDETPETSPEQKAKYVHIGLEKAYRLETLIDELFEISRYNLQNITISKKDIDLYYMIAQLTDEVFPQLTEHGKKTVINIAENLVVYGDPDKLARAFNNILKNAIAYGQDNSVIEITASVEDNAVIIKFKNAGNIPKDKLLTVFDKFHRLNEARSSNTGGAGLGLAIAKEIVALHDGVIRAESESGRTMFIVELPVAAFSLN